MPLLDLREAQEAERKKNPIVLHRTRDQLARYNNLKKIFLSVLKSAAPSSIHGVSVSIEREPSIKITAQNLLSQMRQLAMSISGRSIEGLFDFGFHRGIEESIDGNLVDAEMLFILYFTYAHTYFDAKIGSDGWIRYLHEFGIAFGGVGNIGPESFSRVVEVLNQVKSRIGDPSNGTRRKLSTSQVIERNLKEPSGHRSASISSNGEVLDEKILEDVISLGLVFNPEYNPSSKTREIVGKFLKKHEKELRQNASLRKYLDYHFPTIMKEWDLQNGKPEKTGKSVAITVSNVLSNPSVSLEPQKERIRASVQNGALRLTHINGRAYRFKVIPIGIPGEGRIITPDALLGRKSSVTGVQIPLTSFGLDPKFSYEIAIEGDGFSETVPISSALEEYLSHAPMIKSNIRSKVIANGGKIKVKNIFDEFRFPGDVIVVFSRGNEEVLGEGDSDIDFMNFSVGEWGVSYRDKNGVFPDSPKTLVQIRVELTASLSAANHPNIGQSLQEKKDRTLTGHGERNGAKEVVPELGLEEVLPGADVISNDEGIETAIHTGNFEIDIILMKHGKIEGNCRVHEVTIPFMLLQNGKLRANGVHARIVHKQKKRILERLRTLEFREYIGEAQGRERERLMRKLATGIGIIHDITRVFFGEEILKVDDLLGGFMIRPDADRVIFTGNYLLREDNFDEKTGKGFRNPLATQREKFYDAMNKTGFAYQIQRLDNPKGHISLSLSLPGERHVSGFIRTLPYHPYFSIQFDPLCDEVVKNSLSAVLIKILYILGFLGSEMPGIQLKKSGKKKLSQDQMNQVLDNPHGEYLKSIGSTYTRTIGNVLSMFAHSHGKVAGYPKLSNGYIDYDIHTIKDPEYLVSGPDEAYIVLTDERLSSVPVGQQGDSHIYNLILSSRRLQKYLVKKILATLRESEDAGVNFGLHKKDDGGKDAFTGTMKEEFLNFWSSIPLSLQMGFVQAAKEKSTLALEFKANGTSLVTSLLDYWQSKNLQIRYSRPCIMRLADLRERLQFDDQPSISRKGKGKKERVPLEL